jgi:serine/threonine-protein kinase
MVLRPGSHVGPYEILSAIGAGGMGEVFRAHDAKLGRDVALKILPEAFARDPERIARFRREAQVVASLNHAHIAAIHGFEESDGVLALVLELVEGEDLAQIMSRGAVPVDEAMAIARQIAEGLEAAHEKGIVHRDLKPANVKITPDGVVKILDFGLARALGEESSLSGDNSLTNSPTMARPMTDAGMILGTAAYMSPEQARGKTVDKRSDIWSFGVVLYEMLSGRRLFPGETVSDTLAAVLREPIDWSALPPSTPAPVRRLLERCLDRDTRHRLRDIGEARIALESGAVTEPAASAPPTPPRQRQIVPWLVAAVALTGLVAAIALWKPWREAAAPLPMRLRVVNGTGASIRTSGPNRQLAISPDGTTLVFAGSKDGAAPELSQLFVRRLDQIDATALAGTEGAAHPVFSPDGKWIAFIAQLKLKKVPVTGGAVVTLCSAENARGATWTEDDRIIFSPFVGSTGFLQIPAGGGTATHFGALPAGVLTQRWPQALPDGKGILYTEHTDITDFDNAHLAVIDRAGRTKTVLRGAYSGQYVPSGHLLYIHEHKLMAIRFDLDRLEVAGEGVPLIDGAVADDNTGVGQFAVSSTGTLVYVPGTVVGLERPIDWMMHDGTTAVLRSTPAPWMNPQFSPDGQKLAMDISDGRQRDIYIYEPAGDRLTQLTFDPSDECAPVWSPDGRRMTFASDRAKAGVGNLYSIRADGRGELKRLTESPYDQRPGSWDPTGTTLVYEESIDAKSARVMTLTLPADGGAPHPQVFAELEFGDTLARRWWRLAPSFSPDGRWILYRGQGGPYVRPASGPGQWKIPRGRDGDPASFPRWSPNGKELFVLTGNQIFSARYSVSGDEFRVDAPELWTPVRYSMLGLRDMPYAVHPDGRLAGRAAVDRVTQISDEVVFVFDFPDELRRVLPPDR